VADHAPVIGRKIEVALLLSVCTGASLLTTPATATTSSAISVELFNPKARRRIPLALYHPGPRRPLAVLLPGVGAQLGDYSFLANDLARGGFAVAEVQLELPGDPSIPTSGHVAELRAAELHSGVNSLGYAIAALKRLRYASATQPVVLVGHSNGGDVAMLYQAERPGEVAMIFSLDNLRVPIARTSDPHICSLRSSDKVADVGVLPDDEQRAQFNIEIQQGRMRHDRMWNGGTGAEKRVMLTALARCLKHRRTPRSGP